MKFQRQSEFDKYFEKASAAVALPPALFKAIVGVESAFVPTVFNMHGDKVGLSGINLETTQKFMRFIGQDDPRCAREPEANIMMLAHALRFYYSHLANPELFPHQEGYDPDMRDVTMQWCRDNNSGDPIDYWRRVFDLYIYFSERAGEPQWVKPDEMEGVYIRKRNRDPLYL